ncbi:hypothetical protein D3C80_2150520 [compost metagenome]
MTVAINASTGAAMPFPIDTISGVLATITVSGAAVATTIITMEVTPSDPFSFCFSTSAIGISSIISYQDAWTEA